MNTILMLAAASVGDTLTIISQVLEIGMLVCFGFSWPISVYKSWKGKTSEGKSSVFNILIIVGYIFGITSKFLKMDSYMAGASSIAGGIFIFAIVMYFLNAALVTSNLVLFYIYRQNDRRKALLAETANVACNSADKNVSCCANENEMTSNASLNDTDTCDCNNKCSCSEDKSK